MAETYPAGSVPATPNRALSFRVAPAAEENRPIAPCCDMRDWSVYVGKVTGVPVRVHWLLPVLGALGFAIGSRAGLLHGLLLLVAYGPCLTLTVLFHELAHCWAALRVGATVDHIMLWPLGGLAYISRSPDAKADLKIAAAGPASHLPLLLIFAIAMAVTPPDKSRVDVIIPIEERPRLVVRGLNGPFESPGLGLCEGDCDSDADCASGLSCFQRDGTTPVPGCSGEGINDWDYCIEVEPQSFRTGSCPATCPTPVLESVRVREDGSFTFRCTDCALTEAHFAWSLFVILVGLQIGLFVFNLLIPCYPLDGGRIFVDAMLIRGFSAPHAAKVITVVSIVICCALLGYGLWAAATGDALAALLIMTAVWMLYQTVMLAYLLSYHPHLLLYHPLFCNAVSTTNVLQRSITVSGLKPTVAVGANGDPVPPPMKFQRSTKVVPASTTAIAAAAVETRS